jgi:CBS domain-containing protein/PII-like signaling protein
MSLLRQGKAQALTIYIGESDQWHGRPLYVAIVQLLREQGCAGATVTRAIAGYGAGARLHEQNEWSWSSDAPLIVQVIDQPARLQRLIPSLQEMMQGGLMTLHEVDVLKYTHAHRKGVSSKLPVRQVMETMVTTVGLEAPVSTIVELLLQAPFRVLPVVDPQHYLRGIISTGDLINAGLLPIRRGLVRTARELDSQTAETIASSLAEARRSPCTARDIMNQRVRTIGPEQSIREAAQILIDTQLHNLPVIDAAGRLLGMITRADLLQAIRTSPLMSPEVSSATQPQVRSGPLPGVSLQQQPVTAYLNPDVATVEEQTPFDEVIDALIISPLKRVLVVDTERQVKGIISDVDVLASIQEEVRSHMLTTLIELARGRPARVPTGALRASSGKARVAADVMNRQVVTIPATASVQEAVDVMMETHRKALPVVDREGHLIGTVGRSDVLRILLENEIVR